MKALFKMDFDCGRMGNLEGVFIADTEDVEYLVNNKISVYFGEVLGKHSEISGCVAESEIKQITTDENVIKIVEEYGLNSGYNPLEYTLCTSETEDVPDNGVDWDDCMVQDYIDFKRKGIIPGFYKEEYEVWLKNNNQK
ncbi:MAG: hypothetical protein MSH64_17590 [Bacteroides uniformis]|nr:hypothetical protein [Bacteroides uniformis]